MCFYSGGWISARIALEFDGLPLADHHRAGGIVENDGRDADGDGHVGRDLLRDRQQHLALVLALIVLLYIFNLSKKGWVRCGQQTTGNRH